MVFSSFEYQIGPESFWNHQKWIPREIPRRRRSAGILWQRFESKKLEKPRKNLKNPLWGVLVCIGKSMQTSRGPEKSRKSDFFQNPRKSRGKIKISKIASVKFFKATSCLGSQVLVRFRPAVAGVKNCTSFWSGFSGSGADFRLGTRGTPMQTYGFGEVPGENPDQKEVHFFTAATAGRNRTKTCDPRQLVAF